MDHRMFTEFIQELLNSNWYPKPWKIGVKKEVFETESYSRWTVHELLYYDSQNLNRRPIDNVVLFRDLMDHFACVSKTDTAKFMFSVAYDTVSDILDKML